ncbi:hypothetical protein W03_10320 [Nitrosomonas sp. PY1]|uniref:inositol phosphate phosphatase SopB n=1 Tax=Nitrosomonas sp. PY1 TaxID=1803906 RepID=UPI001FC8C67B|nr:inositol phosphate phosphatase SopB [Nitrosomonas sp. PY1]GKS69028.1 hypothetical protein W03_10320 [Nitrosomonas sp. PY1]
MTKKQRFAQQQSSNPVAKTPKPAATTNSDFQSSARPIANSLQRVRGNPGYLSPADILQLQRTIGNRAVGVLLAGYTAQSPIIQAKLTVNAPGDKYEQEADRVAEQVMRMPAVQPEELEKVDKPVIMTLTETQRDGNGSFEVDGVFERQLAASQGSGQPLPQGLRDEFSTKFGNDFSNVRIHTDSQADRLNQSIHAKAFTTEQDVFFRAGEYNPDSQSGRKLIAHELTHVLQQSSSDNRSMKMGSMPNMSLIQREYDPSDVQKVTLGKLYKMKQCWYEAAKNLIREKLKDKPYINATLENATRRINDYEVASNICEGMFNNENPVIDEDELEQHFPKNLPAQLYREIANVFHEDANSVKEALRNSYIRVLNSRDWVPIVKEMNFGSDQNPDIFTSTITPVNENYDITYGSRLGKRYGQTGFNSMSTKNRLTDMDPKEQNRTTNLAYTEYRAGGANADGKVLFAAFRSGSLSGKSIKSDQDPQANWKVTLENTKELLQAMVIKHLQHVDSTERFNLLNRVSVASIPVTSISLQSGGLGAEGGQIKEQLRALMAFDYESSGKEHTMEIVRNYNGAPTKKYIKVRFNVIALNMGVNAQGWTAPGALTQNSKAIAKLGVAVKDYFTMSRRALIEHRGSLVGKRVAEQSPINNQIKEIKNNNKKIEQLWKKISAGKGEISSYKMSSRIANLAFLLGHMVHFNCKSGKDRTGVQDVESKYLAHRMHRAAENQNPQKQLVPKHKLADESQRDDFKKMLFESGSLEMQEYNTGGQGYKIAPQASTLHTVMGSITAPTFLTLPYTAMMGLDRELMYRIGGDKVLKEIQGLQRYTDIDKI